MSNSIVGAGLAIAAAAQATAPQQQDTTTVAGSPSRVDGGPITIDAHGNVTERTVVRYNTADDRPQAGAPVMDTARSAAGSWSAPVTDKSIVTLPNGMETTVANAIRMGYVRRSAAGGYENIAAKDEQQQAPATTQAPRASTPAEVPIHPETVAVIDKLSASVPPGLMSAAVNAALRGQPVRVIGEHSTLGNDEFTRGVEHVVASLQAHATHTLGTRGIDAADFRAFAEAKHPGEFREAMRMHYETGSVSAYNNLVAKYEALLVNDPSDRFPTRTNADGMMEVAIPGAGWLSLKLAKRAGLIG